MSLGHSGDDPHADQPRATAGTAPEDASAAVVLLHGRGATAQGMLGLAREVGVDGVAYVAPQAAARTWYPHSFLEPVERNEPGRTSGLGVVGSILGDLAADGIPAERTVLLGFSQGGCLATEYAARNPRRYGGVVGLSAGLIGPDVDPGAYEGDVEGTPVFLGCSDSDPHIPIERVHETRDAFENLGADVTERVYEGLGHTVNEDELERVRELVTGVAGAE